MKDFLNITFEVKRNLIFKMSFNYRDNNTKVQDQLIGFGL